jgi:ABC-type transport system involved in cytochrome c biogenesis ATPase subunit
MTISLSDTGKRYNRDWIFRHLSFQFLPGNAYAITGSNGSGKSTLLQAISGSLLINEGTIRYEKENNAITDENIFRHVSLCAPYLELIEEMTATELLNFQQTFKPFLPHFDTVKLLQTAGLEAAAQKQIRYFSVLLLDEPCTNLDQDGIALYQSLLQQHTDNRIVIISSNDPMEYAHCTARIAMGDYK